MQQLGAVGRTLQRFLGRTVNTVHSEEGENGRWSEPGAPWFISSISKLETAAAGMTFPSENDTLCSTREAANDPDTAPRGFCGQHPCAECQVCGLQILDSP